MRVRRRMAMDKGRRGSIPASCRALRLAMTWRLLDAECRSYGEYISFQQPSEQVPKKQGSRSLPWQHGYAGRQTRWRIALAAQKADGGRNIKSARCERRAGPVIGDLL